MPPTPDPPASKERPNWVILLIVIGALGSCGLVVLPIGIYGLRSHLIEKNVVQAKESMRLLADGIAACAATSRAGAGSRLPPTAQPVPRALASVSGCKYVSGTRDWDDEAYRCAGFALSTPQSVQLQWIRSSDSEGYVRGVLDLDGDMKPEVILEQAVRCADGRCTAGESQTR